MKKKLIKVIALLMVLAIHVQLRAQTQSPRKALSFDGVNDYVSGTGISTSLTAITIEAWVYNNTLPSGVVQRYVTINPEVAVLRYDGSASGGTNELHFYIKNTSGSIVSLRVDNVLSTGTWMHVAGTYDGATMKLYLNGKLLKSGAAVGLTAPTGAFSLSASGSEAFNGKMDEVSVWNYARTMSDIREDMYRTAPIANANLKNYWQFNNGSNTTLTDLKGTATGTLNNMTSANWIASTIPFSAGAVNTQRVAATGTTTFTGTGLTMNFTAKSGIDTLLVSRIDTLPNNSPTGVNTVFNSQYWVVNRFGSGTFTTSLTFTLNEDLTASDEAMPGNIVLYKRGSNADAGWTLQASATSVNAAANQATFNGISGFSQFIVARDQCLVYIPDTNFKNALLAIPGLDANSDGKIQCSEATAKTGEINVGGKSISDITGIAAFTNITQLDCSNNLLTALDVSSNTALTYLDCYSNQLTTLNVTGLASLSYIDCSHNKFTGYDFSGRTSLTEIYCNHNLLTSLNISGLASLTTIDCSDNRLATLILSGIGLTSLNEIYCNNNSLTGLNVSGLTSLAYIDCFENQIGSLDFSTNTGLHKLDCNNNLLASLNVAGITSLLTIYCQTNHLTSLDVSTNTALIRLHCSTNLFTSLNVKNGNNSNFVEFHAINNPDLKCIQVDNATWSTDHWTDKDATASYNTVCSTCAVNIPDANFKAALLAIPGLDVNSDGKIQCTEAEAYTGDIDVENKSIADLTGIESFKNIESLNCKRNQLTTLDVSANTLLQYFYCSNNLLTTLNVSGLTSLIESYCENNQLATLDVSSNASLQKLYCGNNVLTTLNATGLTSLSTVDCSHNQLSGLNVAGNTSLSEIYCNDNLLTSLNVTGLSSLSAIDCFNNQLTSLNFTSNTALESLKCYNNLITSLNVTGLSSLLTFYCQTNHLASLNVSTNTSLDDFRCDGNSLTSLSVSGATNITTLNCTGNQLSSLDVSTNINIENLYCGQNVLTGLDVSEVASLNSLDCNDNHLTSLDVSSNSLLVHLNCFNNSLSSLNVKNGNNSHMNTFNSTGNPDLTCIQVDDASWSTAHWPNKDAAASYNTDCSPCAVNIPDDNFIAALLAINGIDENRDGIIQCTEAEAYTGEINVNGKSIDDLTGIEAFTNIAHLDCHDNSLLNLNVTSNTKLTYLDCSNNYLTTLNFSGLTSLLSFYCNNNELSTLDISKNTSLQNLFCGTNNLSELKLAGLTSLSNFDCSNNQLTGLNVAGFASLAKIDCSENQLSDLDLSSNTVLTSLDCHHNSLTSLNVKNGNNTHMTGFNATSNPDLACIQVDDAAYSAAHWPNKDAGANYRASCIVIIPDANFKAALLAIAGLDANGDHEVQCTEAADYNGEINVSGKSIADLTGIESFTNIPLLNCSTNQLTALDVSSNTLLENLNCGSNSLTTLNISGLHSLSIIDCSHNQLSALTIAGFTSLSEIYCNNNLITNLNVTGLTSLLTFYCQTNHLSSMDVSTNKALDDFRCDGNSLTSLNVSGATNITTLNCTGNQLSSLDVSTNINIENLYCGQNVLTGLDVSEVATLNSLDCNDNHLASLDVSSNSLLVHLNCFNNSLTSLNVKNGNNSHTNTFNATGNPDLTCIQVDDAVWSTAHWTNKDADASFSNDCTPPCIVNIPDVNFKSLLLDDASINTNGDDEIQCTEATAYSGTLSATSSNIKDLTGIEAFTNINGLNCNKNEITSLDLTSNTKIVNLDCSDNALTSLNVTGLSSLSNFDCNSNQINTLNVSTNTALTQLKCYSNLLTTLNLSTNIALTNLVCSTNQLTTLNVSGLSSLNYFECSFNQLTSFDLSGQGLTSLSTLYCNENSLASLNVTGLSSLTKIYCYTNQLSALDLTSDTNLEFIDCHNNSLTNLNTTGLLSLTDIECYDNHLTNLNVSSNTSLVFFNCQNNSLASLNVKNGNNVNMSNAFDATKNPDLTCIQVDDAAYSIAHWPNKDATSSYNCATWTGDLTTEWNNVNNWSPKVVPTANYGVIIPDQTNDPVVNEASATPAVCNSMTIQSGAALTIAQGKALTINGNLNNQAGITGLTIKSGDLISGDIGTGSLKIIGKVSGSAKVERYMAPDVWHLISSPTANQPIINFLTYNTDIATTTASAPYTYAMKNYNDAGTGWATQYFKDGKSSEDLFGTGKGYLVRTVGPTVSKIAYFEGTLNTLPIGTSVPVISGWNLVGNPFTSAISINSAAGTASGGANLIGVNTDALTGSYAAIYVWDETKSTTEYQVVNNSSDATYAQVGQGFFVKSAVAGNLNFTSSMQAHQGTAPFKAATAPTPQIKLIAGSSAGRSSTIIKFIEGTTAGLDVGYDAGMFKADQPIALYTKLVEDNGVDFQLQCLQPTGYDKMVIPIGIESKAAGEIVLSVETVQLDPTCKVILEDKLTHTFTDLSKNSYKATVVANTSGIGRFYLHTSDIISSVGDQVLQGKIKAYAIRNVGIKVIGEVGNDAVATLYNGLGKMVLSKKLDAGNLNMIGLPNLCSGVYFLKINDNVDSQTIKVMVRK